MSAAKYMPGTKFELRWFESPQQMSQLVIRHGGLLTWHSTGDPIADPDQYSESFDLNDPQFPENNRVGMTRAEADELCHKITFEEMCNE